jgi:glycosyltransferase involved in cell wall biosynthesis
MNKVLIITYYWPPSGGVGVQRWLKFSKYLPEFGWEPIILTVDPKYAAYPVTDNSLKADLPSSVKVYCTPATDYFRIYKSDKSKIPTSGFANNTDNSLKGKLLRFIRGNFFIPDPRRGWNKYAFKKACELIETEGIKQIITTSPPHSTQLIGLKLAKKYRDLKWLADLRDPWTDIYYYKMFYPTYFSRLIDKRYEKKVLKTAGIITTVGVNLGKMFENKVAGIEKKINILPNGYDENDFAGKVGTLPEKFTISHVGTISEFNPIDGLVNALSKIQSSGIDFVLRFTGIVTQSQKDLITKNLDPGKIEFIPYVDHDVAIQIMLDSSMLLLVIGEDINNRAFLSGKLFEYLASGRQILCLGPEDGEAAKLISQFKQGSGFGYNDSANIESYIRNAIEQPFHVNNNTREYSRRNLTKQLSALLEQ